MSLRGILRLVALGAGVLTIWAAAPLPLASAAYVHEWEGGFPLVHTEEEALEVPIAAAVDNSGGPSSHDLYVGSSSFFSEERFSGVAKYDEGGNFLFEFDGAETPAGSFSFLSTEFFDSGLAVDGSSGPNAGDLYVADVEHGVVDRFNEAGEYLCQITGLATPSASECNGVAGSEVPGGGFLPGGVAVDPTSGAVYVVDLNGKRILRFGADGSYTGQISNPELTNPNAIVIDSTGAIYVANNGSLLQEDASNVVKLSPAGEFLFELNVDDAIRITVDPSSDRVYVAEGIENTRLVEFTPDGHPVSEFGQQQELLVPSLAVDATSGRLYATNFRFEGSTVEMYKRGAIIPDLSTGEATGVEEASAVLHGTVDPAEGGDVTLCEFEYVEAAKYEPEATNPYAAGPAPLPCDQAMPLSEPVPVSAQALGLVPSTTYHFRLVAGNANGKNRGEDTIFATKGAPTIDAEGVTGIERTGATLTGLINPHGYPTEFAFEYVDDQHFAEGGFSSPATKTTHFSELGEGLKPLAVAQGISGLAVGTTYHFRAIARNLRGTARGGEETFTTLPVAAIARQWAYAHLTTATLEASIDPLGLGTSCRVEYLTEAKFQESGYASAESSPCVNRLEGSGARTARAEVSGLTKATTYHFRFVVENASGVLAATDQTFTTFGIEEFWVHVVDGEGNPYTQAGGHPFASITHLTYTHTMVAAGGEGSEGAINAFIKDVLTELPSGRVGGAVATPRCPGYLVEEEKCPGDSQVGTIQVEYFSGGGISTRTRGLFNVYAPPDKASRFSSIDPYVNTDAEIRTGGDYGTTIATNDITEEARIVGVTATIWGVPADPRHDPQRRCPGIGSGCSSDAPPNPLLRNPTRCGVPLTSIARVDTWQGPGNYDTASYEMPEMTGCDRLRFEPTVEVRPTSFNADSPTGMGVQIHLPQDEDPETTGTADLRNAVVRLPEGVRINPAVASGLQSCSPAEVELDGPEPARCPEAAKVGTAQITTTLLDHPLPGAVYVATPYANPFDSLLALYVVIDDPETGVVLKLAGKIEADQATGRLTARFQDNPQLPFEDLDLRLFGGSRAMLRTPPLCGSYESEATLTPWSAPESGPPAESSDRFSIFGGANDEPCAPSLQREPNAPAFEAGSTRPVAGGYTPFVLRLGREDGSQELSSLKVQLPPGVFATLAGVPYCPDAAIAAAPPSSGVDEQAAPPSPEAAAIGSVEIGAGAGSDPYRAPGRVYLAGPYAGAPLSLAVIVPAVAGPYDLGTVVVRAALHIDPATAEVSVETEKLPTILQGIPLDIRTIALRLDRPRFMLNPTSCRPMTMSGQLTSVSGSIAPLASRFQVKGCGRLRFQPRLGLRLLGSTHRGAHPRLRAALRLPSHGANIARAAVTLPPTEFLDNEHLLGICTREQFAADSCPPNSVYGHATAWSPLLDKPLAGPVYLRSSNHRFPDLIADLDGQIHFTLRGRIDSADGGIRVNLEGIPDAPVSKFVLTMLGSDRGLLLNSTNVCKDPRRAQVAFEAQSGTITERSPLIRAQCRNRPATAPATRRASKRKSTRNPPSFGWKPTK